MSFVIEDFVNREEHLDTFWKLVRRELQQQILIIHGPEGIGKTYLLEEYRARCVEQKLTYASLDFARLQDRSYMAIVQCIWEQLGPDGFDVLKQALQQAATLSAEPAQSVSNPARPNATTTAEANQGNASYPSTVQGDQINAASSQGFINSSSGDIQQFFINQINLRDHPQTQRVIQTLITFALRDCLVQLTTTRPVVFFLDSWQEISTDTRDWIYQHFLSWLASSKLPQAVVVLAGREPPNLHQPLLRIKELALSGLPAAAIQTYWVERYGLPPEKVASVIELTEGLPQAIAILARVGRRRRGNTNG